MAVGGAYMMSQASPGQLTDGMIAMGGAGDALGDGVGSLIGGDGCGSMIGAGGGRFW